MTMTTAELEVRLSRLPRVPLGTLPTPLVEAPRLAKALGIGRLLVKRDDLTGLAFGGNKVRQMEFFIGDAKAAGADLLIAGGQVDQSNHARVAAAAARAAGLRALILARPGGTSSGRAGKRPPDPHAGRRVRDPGRAGRCACGPAGRGGAPGPGLREARRKAPCRRRAAVCPRRDVDSPGRHRVRGRNTGAAGSAVLAGHRAARPWR